MEGAPAAHSSYTWNVVHKQYAYWYKTCVSRAHHTADLTHLSVCDHLQRTPGLSDKLTASADISLNVPNYQQSAVTFCGCLFRAVLCVKMTVLSSQGRINRSKQQVTLRLPQRWTSISRCYWSWPRAVSYRCTTFSETSSAFIFKLSWRRWHCFPLNTSHALPVCPTHNVSTEAIKQSTTNQQTQHVYNMSRSIQSGPVAADWTWTKSVCNNVLLDLMYLFSCTFNPYKVISWPLEAVLQYIMYCDWAETHRLVNSVKSATVAVRYNIKICNRKL